MQLTRAAATATGRHWRLASADIAEAQRLLSHLNAPLDAFGNRMDMDLVTACIAANRMRQLTPHQLDFYPVMNLRADAIRPYDMENMQEAVIAAVHAIRQGRPIRILGDFDTDGAMGTVLLLQSLRAFCREAGHPESLVDYYSLSRQREGHNPTPATVDQILSSSPSDEPPLIIHVDNGIRSHAAINHALENGCEVIVLDHHEPDHLENSGIGVDPAGDGSGLEYLSGAGVAHIFIRALAARLGSRQNIEENILPAAIATVADVCAMVGFNRPLVQEGLYGLDQVIEGQSSPTLYPGIPDLLDAARAKSPTTTETIGFYIGPLTNGVSRLTAGEAFDQGVIDDASRDLINGIFADFHHPVVELLISGDPARRNAILHAMSGMKTARAQLETTLQDLPLAEPESPVLVEMIHAPAGMLGILAGRLADAMQRPVILFSDQADPETGCHIGSARYPAGIPFMMGLESAHQAGHLAGFGGHDHGAGGAQLIPGHLDQLRHTLNQVLAEDIERHIPSHTVDAAFSIDQIDPGLVENLNLLHPFGRENPRPLVLVKDVAFKPSAPRARAERDDDKPIDYKLRSYNLIPAGHEDPANAPTITAKLFNVNRAPAYTLNETLRNAKRRSEEGEDITLQVIGELGVWNGRLEMKVTDLFIGTLEELEQAQSHAAHSLGDAPLTESAAEWEYLAGQSRAA